jgi:WD40 repeat protein
MTISQLLSMGMSRVRRARPASFIFIAVVLVAGTVITVQVRRQRDCMQPHKSIPWMVSSLRYTPDGKLLIGADDGGLRAWNLADNRFVWSLKIAPARGMAVCNIRDVRVSRSSRLLGAVVDSGTRALVWDLRTLSLKTTIVSNHTDFTRLAFSPDDRVIYVGDADGSIGVWDSANGAPLSWARKGNGGRDGIESLEVIFDPELVVAGTTFGELDVWNARTRQHVVRKLASGFSSLAVSGDGRRLVSGGYDGSILLWDVDTLSSRPLATLESAPYQMALCESQNVLVTVSGTRDSDGQIAMFDASSGQLQGSFRGRAWASTECCSSPDGKDIVFGGNDSDVRVFQLDALLAAGSRGRN